MGCVKSNEVIILVLQKVRYYNPCCQSYYTGVANGEKLLQSVLPKLLRYYTGVANGNKLLQTVLPMLLIIM